MSCAEPTRYKFRKILAIRKKGLAFKIILLLFYYIIHELFGCIYIIF